MKGRRPATELEDRHAERELVGRVRDPLLAARLLGRHVEGRANRHAHLRERRLPRRPRDAQIDELDDDPAPLARDEVEVRRLDVAVDDADVVERVEAERRLARDVERLPDPQGLPPLAPREVLPFEPLDDEAGAALGVDAVGDVADDVGIVDEREEPGLAAEALERGVVVVNGEQALDGDERAGLPVDGAVDVARRAAPDPRLEGEVRLDPEVVRHPEAEATPNPGAPGRPT